LASPVAVFKLQVLRGFSAEELDVGEWRLKFRHIVLLRKMAKRRSDETIGKWDRTVCGGASGIV
jgi:hypothetical protein